MNTPYPQAPKQGLRLNAFLWLGALLLAGAAFWCWHSVAAMRGMTRADAVIAEYTHGGDGAGRFFNVYRFVTASGKIVSVRGSIESTSPEGDPGDKVAIYYDPDHMERGVIIDRFGERWFGVTVVGVLGAAFVAIGVIVRICSRANGAATMQRTVSIVARRAARTRQILMVGGAAIAFGALCLGGAGLGFFHQFETTRSYERAAGTVAYIANRVNRGDLQSHFKSAVVEFIAADGRKFEVAQGSSSTGITSGDKVRVLYDPHNPQRAIVEGFWDQWAAPLLFTVMGLLFLAAGVFVCVTTLPGGRGGKRRASSVSKRARTGP